MINFKEITDNIASERAVLDDLNKQVYDAQQELKRIESELGVIDRFREIVVPVEHENELISGKGELQSYITEQDGLIDTTKISLDENLLELATIDPTVLIQNLDDGLPIMMLPLRVETKFLRVRSTSLVPRPALQVQKRILLSEDASRQIIASLENIIRTTGMDSHHLSAVAEQLNGLYGILSEVVEVDPLEKQRIDQLIEQIRDLGLQVTERIDTTVADLQANADAANDSLAALVPKNQELSDHMDRIKTLANPLLNQPLSGPTQNLNNAMNTLANTLKSASEVTYTSLPPVLESHAAIATQWNLANAQANLATSLLSTANVNALVATHAKVVSEYQKYTGAISEYTDPLFEQIDQIVRISNLINTEITNIINLTTVITISVAQPPETVVTTTDELWVRMYPDEVAVDDLERSLTQEEYDAGEKYWEELWAAEGDRDFELGLWRNIVQMFGSPRAAYIVKTMTPSNYVVLVPNQRIADATDNVNESIEDFAYSIDTIPIEPILSEQAGAALISSMNELSSSVKNVHQMLPRQVSGLNQTISDLNNLGVDIADTIADSGPDMIVQNILLDVADQIAIQTNFLTTFVNSVEVVTEIDQTDYKAPPEGPVGVTIKTASWTQPPVTKVLPDRFVVALYKNGVKEYEVVGNTIADTVTVGIHPDDNDEYYEPDENGDFTLSPELKWIYDFEDAVKVGMAVRIQVTTDEADPNSATSGFDKLTVLGVKTSSNPDSTKKAVEQLFESHHYSGRGYKLIPQGTPTNNTDKKTSGFTSVETDPEKTFRVERFGAQYINTTNLLSKADGQWLTEALGVDMNTFQNIANSPGFDLRDAIAMNMALWQGTLGGYLEEMFDKLFTVKDIRAVRSIFVRYIKGRGGLPSIQVGNQPYGIIPATVYSRLNLVTPGNKSLALVTEEEKTLMKLKGIVIDILGKEWDDLAKANTKSINDFITGSGDPVSKSQAGLMGMLGLHPNSEDFYQRYSAGQGYAGNFNSLISTAKSGASGSTWDQTAWQNLVSDFDDLFGTMLPGGTTHHDSRIFKTTFLKNTRKLTGQLIDKYPLSELRLVNNVNNVSTEVNFIRYLFETTLDDIRSDITNKTEPSKSLFYLMLRYAQFMQYWDAAMEILIQGGYLQGETTVGSGDRKGYQYFNGAGTATVPPRSKWFYLFTDMFGLRGKRNESLTMAQYLETDLIRKYPAATASLKDFKRSLSVLAGLSTAKLERVFTEHLDVCTFRLDSWYLGLTHKHLVNLRLKEQKNTGLYLGAYGYLEGIKPGPKRKDLQGNDIVYGYNEGNPLPLSKAPGNQGYIHGPSLGHAITAAILRNGYITHATPDKPDLMAVDIASQRVRKAWFYIEGIRSGQNLSSLLGYQFERALRDKYPVELAMQLWAYELRKLFPLAANKIQSTAVPPKPVENLAADNVVDGLKMIEAFKAGGAPFQNNTITLPGLTDNTAKAGLLAELRNLLDALDALADLTLSEGVFQLSQGNAERSHAVMDAISQANRPIPTPEILDTPRTGTAITNRVTINMEPFAKPVDPAGAAATVLAANPWPSIPLTPRAISELSLNKWLGTVVAPDPTLIKCVVKYANAATPTVKTTGELHLGELGLQPVDLMYGMGSAFDIDGDDGELSKILVYNTKRKYTLADDAIVTVELRTRPSSWPANSKTFYELSALISNLHKLIASSRTLTPDDLMLPGGNSGPGATDLEELYNRVKYPRVPPPPPPPPPPSEAEPVVSIATVLMSMAMPIVDALGQAVPMPPTKYNASAGAFDMLQNILIRLTYYYNQLAAAAPVNTDFTEARNALYEASTFGIPQAIPESITGTTADDKFALRSQIDSVGKIIRARLNEFTKTNLHIKLPDGNTSAQNTKLLIEGLNIIFDQTINVLPLFTLHNPVEMQSAYQLRQSILPVSDPYCIDKWTRGIARVRNKMNVFERVATLYDIFEHRGLDSNNQAYNQFDLSVMQLSYTAMDFWAGYYYGPDKEVTTEVLCIMMALPPNYAAGVNGVSNQHVGLLIDDWVEMIPNRIENTGVAVHYDQPNSKPPQSILLAVTPNATGRWQWSDLSDTLLETIELAKKRAVEPDHYTKTPYSYHNLFNQILPAMVSEVSQDNNTISKDLSANINQALTS